MRNLQEIIQEGLNLFHQKKYQESLTLFDKLAAMFPDHPDVLGFLGSIYQVVGQPGTAISVLNRAVELSEEAGKPNAAFLGNLANVLKRENHREAAQMLYERALEANPEDIITLCNYSGMFINADMPEKAEMLARKAIALHEKNNFINIEGQANEPTLAKHHLSLALLEQGKWQEAWEYYDYRKTTEGWQRPQYTIPEWKGQETGTLVIHGEQGLGDEIMYCSLIEQLKGRAKKIYVEANHRILPLLRRSLDLEVYPDLESIPEKPDHIIAMGSLPKIVGLTRAQSRTNGYLRPDKDRVQYWSNHLRSLSQGKPIIGIAWTGGVQQTHKAVRNPPRELFKQLQNYFLVSVQYTPGAKEQAEELGAIHYQNAIDDLDEQCALIASLDCLVTVAQTAMHFAGGMNVPTLALISDQARWDCIGNNEGEIPWWKSVKSIRKKDTWEEAFDRLKVELESRYAAPSDIAAE